jgi:hypothetical protein
MKKAFVLVAIITILFAAYGCGHHKRHKNYTTVTVIDSSTSSAVPSNSAILIHEPAAQSNAALLAAILSQLEEFSLAEQIEVNVTVEVTNEVETNVTVEGNRIVISPGRLGHIPPFYHHLCRFHNKKCKKHLCKKPKPCNNEED